MSAEERPLDAAGDALLDALPDWRTVPGRATGLLALVALALLAGCGATAASGRNGGTRSSAGQSPSSVSASPVSSPVTAARAGLPAAGSRGAVPAPSSTGGATKPGWASGLKSVFLIVMENANWSSIRGNASAPYINGTLLRQGAHAERYFNPPGNHPSEPNYLWLEAGTNFGITNDKPPSANHQASTMHLVTLLQRAGISWRGYQEGISGQSCPLSAGGLYVPKHNPMVFFDDVTGSNNARSAYCIAHERPFSQLRGDLARGTVAGYNFITPNLCNDMHNSFGCPTGNSLKNGDTWLSREIPPILASSAYRDGGLVLITWDEGEGGDGPIGLIALTPGIRPGYANTIHYTHSSTLRTVEEIFGVRPFLGDAAHATDLGDLLRPA